MKLKLIKKVDLPYATVQLFEPPLLRVEITMDLVITKVEAAAINEVMGILSGGKEMPYMLLANEKTQFDSSSREYTATTEGSRYKKAEALVIRTLAHRLLAELYLKINQPPKPCKTFTNEEDAVDWLLTFH
ncbi:MAG: hypothetical protein JWO32_1419 [Bacteroidetes bacterium]|nr:hypothetical protein [Bacteroidota bacterium]